MSKRSAHLDQAPPWYRCLVYQLRQRRNDLGLTGLDIDHAIGCTNGLTNKWECYDRIPSGFMLTCWLDVLGLTLAVQAVE